MLNPPGSLPILPLPPSFTHPDPAAAGHLGNAAASRTAQVTGSQERESFKALDLFFPFQKCLRLCPFLSRHAAPPFIQALLFSCQCPDGILVCGFSQPCHPPQLNLLSLTLSPQGLKPFSASLLLSGEAQRSQSTAGDSPPIDSSPRYHMLQPH